MTITLPPSYSAVESSLAQYAHDLLKFLSSPQVHSIFAYHPNFVVVNGPHPEWNGAEDGWWSWSTVGARRWEIIVDLMLADSLEGYSTAIASLPESLRQLLLDARRLALPRESGDRKMDALRDGNGRLPVGMNAKKAHEVRRMSAFVGDQVCAGGAKSSRVVDIGAGQGYLSRALAEPPHSFHVLALDSSEVQTNGAREQEAKSEKRRAKKKKDQTPEPQAQDTDLISEPLSTSKGSLSHLLLRVDAESLDQAITQWVADPVPSLGSQGNGVHLVALHACGALTPNVMRQVVTQSSRAKEDRSLWEPTGMTAVGCCYHLINLPQDFPMSSLVQQANEHTRLQLLAQHLHLAAQCPTHWRSTPEAWLNAKLAVKKIVYRALLMRILPSNGVYQQTGEDGEPSEHAPRLGRLHDRTYASWSTFLDVAAPRMGVDRASIISDVGPDDDDAPTGGTASPNDWTVQRRRIEVLHILRCVLGPVVESLIILDRYLYLKEHLPVDEWQVDTVNLFDQSTGSARNVCLAATRL